MFNPYYRVANELEDVRAKICPYPDNTCDCKTGISIKSPINGEVTGCPELRQIIATYIGWGQQLEQHNYSTRQSQSMADPFKSHS